MMPVKSKTHIIIFVDGSSKEIMQEQYDKIMLLSTNSKSNVSSIVIDGGLIKFHSISKMLSLEEYYEQYPDRKPTPVYYSNWENRQYLGASPNLPPEKLKVKRKKALEGLIKGITKYIKSSENRGTGKPEKLLEKMKGKLSQVNTDNYTNVNDKIDRVLFGIK